MYDDEGFLDPINGKDMTQFIRDCVENSIFESQNSPEDYSVILTFSTDITDESGNRFLVHAYLDEQE